MEWLRKSSSSTPSTATPTPSHSYLPTEIVLDHFVSNQNSLFEIATAFVTLWTIILGSAWYLTSKLFYPNLQWVDRLTTLWFILCGSLHIFFEGYLVLHHGRLASKQGLFAQLWKEYALSDSRYLTNDSFVLCVESITVAVLGPLSFLTALSILRSSSYRHPLQATVSIMHIYGDALYLSTALFDLYGRQIAHSRPEAMFFWFYFVILNGIWLIIPSILLYRSVRATAETFSAWQEVCWVYDGKAAKSEKDPQKRALLKLLNTSATNRT